MIVRRRLAAGNWQMNGNRAALAEVRTLLDSFTEPGCDILVCPPATLIAEMATLVKGSAISVGGQDCHPKSSGAHTGNISADMLADAGASAVILGHSERRSEHGESDLLVRAKAEAALKAGVALPLNLAHGALGSVCCP